MAMPPSEYVYVGLHTFELFQVAKQSVSFINEMMKYLCK